jgi:hypothetical protein
MKKKNTGVEESNQGHRAKAGGGGEGRRFAVKTCGAAARRGRVTVQLLFFIDLCSHLFLDSSRVYAKGQVSILVI